jgi:hypothetical protein
MNLSDANSIQNKLQNDAQWNNFKQALDNKLRMLREYGVTSLRSHVIGCDLNQDIAFEHLYPIFSPNAISWLIWTKHSLSSNHPRSSNNMLICLHLWRLKDSKHLYKASSKNPSPSPNPSPNPSPRWDAILQLFVKK